MKIEMFSMYQPEASCQLALQAQDMPGRTMNLAELDKPLRLTQESREQLPPLSSETRERLKQGDYPDTVLDAIGSEAEGGIYEKAELEATVVNDKDALIRTDIDLDKTDVWGETNLERMKEGLAPLDSQGKPIELHHIGQKPDSPLAELTGAEHRSNGNDNILHDKLKETEINRADFCKERIEHWKARAQQIENQRGEGTA
ncbi:HNH/ENDO VII family nuclease [Janthinobacterium sp. J1-1]|uniref:HNH/ENDO VII family nuclease n=1 Tax=unclassified Janthinobacterium TaxID=2610881 RepID=UPI00281177D5|nr:HNH/ENDO VII family nuclease [Janthinobacterium sp. J1-1]